MKEYPILFSGAMVRAILAGRKTQTRRMVKPQPVAPDESWYADRYNHSSEWALWGARKSKDQGRCTPTFKEPASVGDHFWVRETWAKLNQIDDKPNSKDRYTYRADWNDFNDAVARNFKWRPSIHMPRIAARIILEVTEVRVEQVYMISEADAVAEGAVYWEETSGGVIGVVDNCSPGQVAVCRRSVTPRVAFGRLWQEINGVLMFDDERWVWVYSFKRVEGGAV